MTVLGHLLVAGSLKGSEAHRSPPICQAIVAQWPRDAAHRMSDVPRLHPRTHAPLKIRNDLIGNPCIDVGARRLVLPAHLSNLRSGGRVHRGPVTAVSEPGPQGAGCTRRAATQWKTAKPVASAAGPGKIVCRTGVQGRAVPSSPLLVPHRRHATSPAPFGEPGLSSAKEGRVGPQPHSDRGSSEGRHLAFGRLAANGLAGMVGLSPTTAKTMVFKLVQATSKT